MLNAGSTSDGTLQYSSDNINYSTTIPSGTNANTYTSYWRIIGDSNHNDKPYASISTTVSAKTVSSPTITLSQTAYTYNNSACQPTPTVKDGSTTITSSEYTVSYSNNTNVGTATCTITDKTGGNYTVSGSKTFTINCYSATAPTAKNPNWTGSAQNLVNAGSTSYGTMVYCTTSGGTFSTTIPQGTNAGSYEVWYKVSGNTNVCPTAATKVACSIKQVAMTYTAPSATTYTYANTNRNSASGGSATGGSIQYCTTSGGTYSTTIPTNKTVGTYDVWWKAVPDSNHSGGTNAAKLTATINCYSATAPKACGLTYNGSAQNLVSGGSTSYGTMVYCSTSGGSFSSSITQGTNAGSYDVWWKVSGNTNVCNTAATKIACSIAKRQVTCTAPSAKSLTWNGSAQTLANAGSVTSGTMTYCSTSGGTYSSTIPTGTAATGYTVWYKSTPDSNHSGTCSGSTACSIGKKTGCAISFGTTAVTKTYGNAAFTNAITNTGDGSLTWGSSNTNIATVASNGQVTIKAAGSCTISATTTSTTNCTYSTTAASYTLSVAKADQSAPTATGATVTYHNTATATASGGGGQGTLTWTNGSTRTATGTTTTAAYWSGNSNYNASPNSNSVNIVVNKATDQSITVTTTNRTYNGSSQVVASATAHGISNYYLGFGSSSTSAPTSWGSANSSISQTNAGTYYVWYKGTADGNHSGDISATYKGPVTMNKAAGSVTTAPVNNGSAYGSGGYLCTAGSGTGTMMYKVGSGSYSSSRPTTSGLNAGSYTLYYKASASTNYNESSESSITVTVVKAAMSYVAPKAATRTYTGSAQQIVSGASATGGSIYYATSSAGASSSTTVPTKTTAGTYSTYWKAVVTDTTNYSGGTSSWAQITGCTIDKAPGSVTTAPTNSNAVYGSGDYLCSAGSGTGTMRYKLGSGSWSSSRPTTSGLDAGSYTLYYKASASTNYNESASASTTVTVVQAPCCATAPTPSTSMTFKPGTTYRLVTAGSSSCGTMKYSTTKSGTYSTSIPTVTSAGTYTTYWKVECSGNYSGTASGSVSTTIAKAVCCDYTTAPKPCSLTYNGSAQALVSGGSTSCGTLKYATASTATYSTTIPKKTAVGTYTTYWKVDSMDTTNFSGTCSGTVSTTIINKKTNKISISNSGGTILTVFASSYATYSAFTSGGGVTVSASTNLSNIYISATTMYDGYTTTIIRFDGTKSGYSGSTEIRFVTTGDSTYASAQTDSYLLMHEPYNPSKGASSTNQYVEGTKGDDTKGLMVDATIIEDEKEKDVGDGLEKGVDDTNGETPPNDSR